MTNEAIITSVAINLMYGVILLCSRNRLFWWYTLVVLLGTALRWLVLWHFGHRSAEFYYAYHAHVLVHPLFQSALLLTLYRRRSPDLIRWLTTAGKSLFFASVVYGIGAHLADVHTALIVAEWGLAGIVLAQVLMTGARERPEEGGILAGIFIDVSLSLCLYGARTFGGVEWWTAWVQQAALAPWTLWMITAIRARSSVRKGAVAGFRRQAAQLPARFAAARNTIHQRVAIRRRVRTLISAFRPPFINSQFTRKG